MDVRIRAHPLWLFETSWSARHLRSLRHSHIQNLTLISDHSLAALHLPCRHLAINLSLAQRKQRIGEERLHYLYIFCRKKQRTNAKSGRTKVADWQHVGA